MLEYKDIELLMAEVVEVGRYRGTLAHLDTSSASLAGTLARQVSSLLFLSSLMALY